MILNFHVIRFGEAFIVSKFERTIKLYFHTTAVVAHAQAHVTNQFCDKFFLPHIDLLNDPKARQNCETRV